MIFKIIVPHILWESESCRIGRWKKGTFGGTIDVPPLILDHILPARIKVICVAVGTSFRFPAHSPTAHDSNLAEDIDWRQDEFCHCVVGLFRWYVHVQSRVLVPLVRCSRIKNALHAVGSIFAFNGGVKAKFSGIHSSVAAYNT